MLLNQISRGSGGNSAEQLRAAALGEFLTAFPLANYLQFYSHAGNADSPRKPDGDMTAGGNRTIGNDYGSKADSTPAFGAANLKIYGGKVKTDKAYIRRGIDIGDQRLLDLKNFTRSLARYFMNALINEELDADTFSGLKEQATGLSRIVNNGTSNGASLPAGTVTTDVKLQMAHIEMLESQMEGIVGGPDAILCNGAYKARLKSIARSHFEVSTLQDFYGANQRVDTFNGVPVVNIGYKNDGSTLIIPNNEECGSSGAVCTSIYLVKFGERENITVATNVGMDVEDLGLVGTAYETMVEFDVDLVVLAAKALTRINGIIL